MDKITFLGTGGGRMAMTTQLRSTAGMYLEISNKRIYLDPGPGALVYSIKNKIPLSKLDLLLVSHKHVDHSNDAGAIIESMTEGTKNRRGTVAAAASVLEGDERAISPYHQSQPEKIIPLKPNDTLSLDNLNITATPTAHTDDKGIGFIFHAKKQISYLSDTIYRKDIAKAHKGAKVLILNCVYLKWDPEKSPGQEKKHMDVDDAIRFINDIKPELTIIQHIGMSMIRYGPHKIAEEIEQKTKIRTIIPNDRQTIEIEDKKTLGDWKK